MNKTGKVKKVSNSTKKEIVKRYRAGESAADLADEYGVGKSSIWVWGKKFPRTRGKVADDTSTRIAILERENERLRGLLLDAILGEIKIGE